MEVPLFNSNSTANPLHVASSLLHPLNIEHTRTTRNMAHGTRRDQPHTLRHSWRTGRHEYTNIVSTGQVPDAFHLTSPVTSTRKKRAVHQHIKLQWEQLSEGRSIRTTQGTTTLPNRSVKWESCNPAQMRTCTTGTVNFGEPARHSKCQLHKHSVFGR